MILDCVEWTVNASYTTYFLSLSGVLNLWVMHDFYGEGQRTLYRDHLRPSENTDIHVKIHNHSKNYSYEVAIKIIL